MKVGVRKPSIKGSISARTTGKVKRKLKRLWNPLYGKKGMGWVQNPKKALYNKVYRKTTISSKKLISGIVWLFIIPFILTFYALKYTCLLIWWACVMMVNGIIALVEFVVNLNAEEAENIRELQEDEVEKLEE